MVWMNLGNDVERVPLKCQISVQSNFLRCQSETQYSVCVCVCLHERLQQMGDDVIDRQTKISIPAFSQQREPRHVCRVSQQQHKGWAAARCLHVADRLWMRAALPPACILLCCSLTWSGLTSRLWSCQQTLTDNSCVADIIVSVCWLHVLSCHRYYTFYFLKVKWKTRSRHATHNQHKCLRPVAP